MTQNQLKLLYNENEQKIETAVKNETINDIQMSENEEVLVDEKEDLEVKKEEKKISQNPNP